MQVIVTMRGVVRILNVLFAAVIFNGCCQVYGDYTGRALQGTVTCGLYKGEVRSINSC